MEKIADAATVSETDLQAEKCVSCLSVLLVVDKGVFRNPHEFDAQPEAIAVAA